MSQVHQENYVKKFGAVYVRDDDVFKKAKTTKSANKKADEGEIRQSPAAVPRRLTVAQVCRSQIAIARASAASAG
jgi:hypothetical protein